MNSVRHRTFIRGGLLADGTGAPLRPADVVVEGPQIAALVAPGSSVVADEVIDATGLIVAPGFIDEHTHSDLSLLSAPEAPSAIGQGITTQLVGLCGFSAGPWDHASRAAALAEDPVYGFPDVAVDWSGIRGYRDALAQARPATNVATLVGHTTVRRLAMGGAARAATHAEIGRMADAVRGALDDGAAGFSSGLSYPPASSAETGELVALASVTAQAGKPYHTHLRGQGTLVLDSLAEALETARRAGVRLIVSHLYPAFSAAWGLADRILETLDAAVAAGADVVFDLTVFPRGGGALAQLVPVWATDGGAGPFRERMTHPAQRRRLRDDLARGGTPPGYPALDWEDQLICRVTRASLSTHVGRSVADVARARGVEPIEAAIGLLEEDIALWVAPTIKSQADLDRLLAHPRCVPVSDGFSADPARHRELGILPKAFGTFPHVLGSYARDRGIVSMVEAVRRMTSMPAERMGLAGRGRLAPAMAADMVLFDPATVAGRAHELDPTATPSGIAGVMVNGAWAIRDGGPTGARNGVVL